MRKFLRPVIFIILVLCMAVVLLTACSGTDTSSTASDVLSVRINSFPFASTEIFYGDELDLEGATLLVVRKGGSSVVDITADMISGYNKLATGTQVITVSYEGHSATVEVSVKELAVSRIDIVDNSETISVVQGSELNLAGISLKVTYQNGRTVTVSQITDVMVRGYSSDLAPGTHDIFIDYSGYSVALEIEVVAKTVISVDIVSEPSINSYFVKTAEENEGALDPTGLVIQRNFDNNTSDTLVYSAGDEDFVFEYDFTRANAYSQVVMYYRGCYESFNVKVLEPQCSRVQITKYPVPVGIHLDPDHVSDLNSLIQGDKIDWSTGAATVYFNDGTQIDDIPLSDLVFGVFVDRFDQSGYIENKEDYIFNEVGTHTVYVRYGNYDIPSEIGVTVVAKEPYSLILADSRLADGGTDEDGSVTLAREFIEGTRFDTGYLRYNIRYDNGTYEYPADDVSAWASINADMLADEANNSLTLSVAYTDAEGYQSVIFEVNGVQNRFRVKVVAKLAEKLVLTAPYKNYYAISSSLDLTGSALYAEFNDNSVELLKPIPAELITLKNADGVVTEALNSVGTYTATVTYYGSERTFTFEVVPASEAVTSVAFNAMDADSVYYYDTYASIFNSGLTVTVVKGSGSYTLPVTEDLVLSSDPDAVGYQEILFRYEGYTFTLKANVGGRNVVSVEVTRAPDKLVYVPGVDKSLDLTGLQVTRIFNDNTYGQVSSFSSSYWSFTGYDLTSEGVQSVEVAYAIEGRTFVTSFEIIVSSAEIVSVEFDEAYNADALVNLDGKNVYYVTYRDDLNTTYEYRDEIADVSHIDELALTVRYADGKTEHLPLRAANVSYDKNVTVSTDGNYYIQSVQINFGGFTDTMYLCVVKRTLVSIEVYSAPDLLIYAEGQQLVPDGGYIRRIYDNGDTDVVPMTSGLVAISGYTSDPFANIQGGTSKTQEVTVTYASFSTSFTVTSYRKLTSAPVLNNTSFFYGKTSDPIITFNTEVEGFVKPETYTEYFVDGEWTTTTPKYPGIYAMRVIVNENEYYKAMVWEGYEYTVKVAVIVITVENYTKEYGEADPELTYDIADGELVPGDVIEVVLSRAPGEDVGTYAITAALTDSGFNQNALYKLTYDKASLIITPKQVGYDATGKPIGVQFGMPDNYHNGVIEYTGSEIRAISAMYSDNLGNVIIDAEDIEYYDASGNLMTTLPKEKGTYTVRISDNYAFAEGAVNSITFVIS